METVHKRLLIGLIFFILILLGTMLSVFSSAMNKVILGGSISLISILIIITLIILSFTWARQGAKEISYYLKEISPKSKTKEIKKNSGKYFFITIFGLIIGIISLLYWHKYSIPPFIIGWISAIYSYYKLKKLNPNLSILRFYYWWHIKGGKKKISLKMVPKKKIKRSLSKILFFTIIMGTFFITLTAAFFAWSMEFGPPFLIGIPFALAAAILSMIYPYTQSRKIFVTLIILYSIFGLVILLFGLFLLIGFMLL